MPQILPFPGIRYTTSAGDLAQLLAPPYDVISPAQQQALARRSAQNAVHLELAEGGDERYARVADLLRQWEGQGLLARDATPMLYVYEQQFEERGAVYSRRTLLASVEAQPWEEGAVRPHEYTLSAPKEDRLKLLLATGVQLSPVFMIARDRAGQLRAFLDETIASRAADIEATTPEGDTHRLWLIEAGRYEMRRLAPLLSESFTIADGHHRYETAVAYRAQRLAAGETLPRDHPARFAMAAIVAADDPGLVIRPIHRVVPRQAPADWRERIAGTFAIDEIPGPLTESALLTVLEAAPRSTLAVGLEQGKAHLLRPLSDDALMAVAPAGQSLEWMQVPAMTAQYGVIGPVFGITADDLASGAVTYTHLAGEALAAAGEGACAFLIHPVDVHDVITLADRGERMPQKSTFFYPKLGTGLVFYALNP